VGGRLSRAPLRVGLMTLPHGPYPDLAARWRRIEALGFEGIHLPDHLVYPKLIAYECWTLLGALAAITERVRIGALVSPVTLRHPALLAQHASSVDRMSGGRFELGLGAGGARGAGGGVAGGGRSAGGDEVALGGEPWSPAERIDRLGESLEICDRLLRGETLAYDGRRYRVRASVPAPIRRPRPPLAVAARGPRALALAARHADVWVNQGGRDPGTPDDPLAAAVRRVRREREALDRHCAAIGRDPRMIRRRVLAFRATPAPLASLDAFDEYVGSFLEIGMDELVLYWPERPDGGRDEAGERMLERVAAERL